MDIHPLQSYRERAGLTLDVLAERVGVSKATLSRVENRKQDPSLDLIGKLKAASNGEISADDFLPQPPDQSDDEHGAHSDQGSPSDSVQPHKASEGVS